MGARCFKGAGDGIDAGDTPGGPTEAANRRAGRSHTRGHDPGVGPSNKLICRKPPSWKSDVPMTTGQLLSKRDEFWDTAPAFNGRAEIWQALRAAAECEDTETAQAITAAVNVTLPLGNLSMAYDELGNKYEIPPYCLSKPSNLIHDDPANAAAPAAGPGAGAQAAGQEPEDLADIAIKLRLNTGKEIAWTGHATSKVALLKNHVSESEGVSLDRIRILFSGQLLTDTQTLAEKKVVADSIVQVMVRPED